MKSSHALVWGRFSPEEDPGRKEEAPAVTTPPPVDRPQPAPPGALGSLAASWQRLDSAGEGPGRRDHTCNNMFYDVKRRRCVFMGGQMHSAKDTSRRNDVWALEATRGAWTCLAPHRPDADNETCPPGRTLFGVPFVYDPGNDLYLCGATGWAYDPASGKWRKLGWRSGNDASSHYHMGMAYYPPKSMFLVAGGCMWAKNLWADPVAARTALIAKTGFVPYWPFGGMVYLPDQERFLIFGGTAPDDHKKVADATVAYDPRSDRWEELQPAHRPPARMSHKLVWCETAGVVALFGGGRGLSRGLDLRDLWVFDPAAGDWTELEAEGGPYCTGAACYDARIDAVVVFTSKGETWLLRLRRQRPAH